MEREKGRDGGERDGGREMEGETVEINKKHLPSKADALFFSSLIKYIEYRMEYSPWLMSTLIVDREKYLSFIHLHPPFSF